MLTPQADRFIRPSWGRGTFERLHSLGVDVDFVSVPGLQHEMNSKETEERWTTYCLVVVSFCLVVVMNGFYLVFGVVVRHGYAWFWMDFNQYSLRFELLDVGIRQFPI